QLVRNGGNREPLSRQFGCDNDACSCIHVQSLRWTVGFLRQQCGLLTRLLPTRYCQQSFRVVESWCKAWKL
ncbi:MAG: hypothetical protein OEV27_16335, partial [Nitrospira sp.]|nr:hypothetical protein [Nitrospira sp.]